MTCRLPRSQWHVATSWTCFILAMVPYRNLLYLSDGWDPDPKRRYFVYQGTLNVCLALLWTCWAWWCMYICNAASALSCRLAECNQPRLQAFDWPSSDRCPEKSHTARARFLCKFSNHNNPTKPYVRIACHLIRSYRCDLPFAMLSW